MREDTIEERIRLGRSFITKFASEAPVGEDYRTDQELKRPQPPLAKVPMTQNRIQLPKSFDGLLAIQDFLQIVNMRRSHRVYTDESISLPQLSCLLWCTQGVKSVRGK